jgi:transposase
MNPTSPTIDAPCLIGLEACASAHHWARELMKLGHEVRLMPAKDMRAYVKRNKNDAADAEAICEAVRRPTIRFVQVKSAAQQGQLMQHRTRDLLMRQRTQIINALRAHLAELGQGREGVKELLAIIADKRDEALPLDAQASLLVLAAQLQALQTLIGSIEKRIVAQHRANADSKRLETIPGIGVVGATDWPVIAISENGGKIAVILGNPIIAIWEGAPLPGTPAL